jgi:hypothetical protein
VGEIEKYKFKVGQITQDLMAAYGDLVRNQKKPANASAA